MNFRFLTSGESHGCCLNMIIDGVPSNVRIESDFINQELRRRQHGYGRGARMQIETDCAQINSGVRLGFSTGAPICLEIKNKDHEKWLVSMNVAEQDMTNPDVVAQIKEKEITKLRPGHADFAGAVKYNQKDIRNILERSSARETAARVAVGAIAKTVLKEFGIEIFSHVIQIGKIASGVNYFEYDKTTFIQKVASSPLYCFDEKDEADMKKAIDEAMAAGTTLGGKIEVVCRNLPVGLGSFVQWDRKLDGKLAQAVMSVNAVKSVEIGDSTLAAENTGADFQDEIFYSEGKFYHKTNHCGGIEGGMTNGEDVVIKAVMKPIPTMKTPLNSVDFITKEVYPAHFERSDACAVPACAVVIEAMCAITILDEFLQKFGGDSIEEVKSNFERYQKYLKEL